MCLIIYNIACKKSINYFIFIIDTLISEFINEHHTNDRSDNPDKQQYPDIEISSENMNLIQVEGELFGVVGHFEIKIRILKEQS